MKIAVLGTGTWGTALAVLLANNGHIVQCYCRDQELCDTLNNSRKHPFLPNATLPNNIIVFSNFEETTKDVEMVVFAVPSIAIRSVAEAFKPFYKNQLIVTVAKGIEEDTLFTTSETIEDVLNIKDQVVALTGPTHAEEVSIGLPTCIVAASPNIENATNVAKTFCSPVFKVYTNEDRRGSELCGAFKNVIALACGMSDGMGFGDNTKAAIMTRGIAELKRLGIAMGCNNETFSGLTGVGDLIVTATSKHSRNNRAGYLIGSGKTVEEALKEVGMVVEGINCLKAAEKLIEKYNIYMPIVTAVNNIVNNHLNRKEIVNSLISLDIKNE